MKPSGHAIGAAASGCAVLALLFGCGGTSSPAANGEGSQFHGVTAHAQPHDLPKVTTSSPTQAPAGARALRGSIVLSDFPLDGSAKQPISGHRGREPVTDL